MVPGKKRTPHGPADAGPQRISQLKSYIKWKKALVKPLYNSGPTYLMYINVFSSIFVTKTFYVITNQAFVRIIVAFLENATIEYSLECVYFCMITQNEIDIGTQNWNIL